MWWGKREEIPFDRKGPREDQPGGELKLEMKWGWIRVQKMKKREIYWEYGGSCPKVMGSMYQMWRQRSTLWVETLIYARKLLYKRITIGTINVSITNFPHFLQNASSRNFPDSLNSKLLVIFYQNVSSISLLRTLHFLWCVEHEFDSFHHGLPHFPWTPLILRIRCTKYDPLIRFWSPIYFKALSSLRVVSYYSQVRFWTLKVKYGVLTCFMSLRSPLSSHLSEIYSGDKYQKSAYHLLLPSPSPTSRNRDLGKFWEILRNTVGRCKRWNLENISAWGGWGKPEICVLAPAPYVDNMKEY